MTGFIKLHRQILAWDWISKPNTFCLFMHLLLRANHTERSWQGIPIGKGQLVTGRKKLSEETGLSEREIRTALEHLKSTNEVTIKTSNKFSIITITNWEKYQTNDQQNASNRPAIDQQATTPKECKKERKKESKERTHKKKPPAEQKTAKEDYAFEGHVIKLNKKDYYGLLEIWPYSEERYLKWLDERDDWLAMEGREDNWYISTTKAIQKIRKEFDLSLH